MRGACAVRARAFPFAERARALAFARARVYDSRMVTGDERGTGMHYATGGASDRAHADYGARGYDSLLHIAYAWDRKRGAYNITRLPAPSERITVRGIARADAIAPMQARARANRKRGVVVRTMWATSHTHAGIARESLTQRRRAYVALGVGI